MGGVVTARSVTDCKREPDFENVLMVSSVPDKMEALAWSADCCRRLVVPAYFSCFTMEVAGGVNVISRVDADGRGCRKPFVVVAIPASRTRHTAVVAQVMIIDCCERVSTDI